MATRRDVLLSEDTAGQAELLLNLLSEASAGKELSNIVSDVVQVLVAAGVGSFQVRKLAYDLCKTVALLDSDYSLIVDGIKTDLVSGIPELQVIALDYLPYLPPHHLVALLETGVVERVVVPLVRSTAPPVRAAATTSLSSLLLLYEVQEALAASASLAASAPGWWEAVADGVADQMADVITASIAATNKLFSAAEAAQQAGPAGGAGISAGAPEHTGAARTAFNICSYLGPLLDTWRMLPSHAQVATCQLLGHLARHLLLRDAELTAPGKQRPPPPPLPSAGGDPQGLPFDLIGGGGGAADDSGSGGGAAGTDFRGEANSGTLSAALPSIVAYLSNCLQSIDAGVKLEAPKVLLRLSRLSSSHPGLSAMRAAAAVPSAVAAAAMEALFELTERVLSEAALQEVAFLVASHLDVLQVETRLAVLQRLWRLIALLQSPTDRMVALAHAWRAALALHLDAKDAIAKGLEPQGSGVSLAAILSDSFLQDVISGRLAAGDQGGTSSGDASTASAAAGPIAGVLAPGSNGGASTSEAEGGGKGYSSQKSSRLDIRSSKRLLRNATSALAGGARVAGDALAGSARVAGEALAGAADTAKQLVKAGGLALPRYLDTSAPFKASLPPALKQEMVCTLLEVLAAHPSASAALMLPPAELKRPPAPPPPRTSAGGSPPPAPRAASSATAASASSPGVDAADGGDEPPTPQRPPPPASPAAAALEALQERAVLWVGAACAALQLTRSCLHWEPLVPPPMPGQPAAPPLPPTAGVNLTTVPVDIWLQLLQSCCHAVRALLLTHGYTSLKVLYRCNSGRMLPFLTHGDAVGYLARLLEDSCGALQTMMNKALTEWRSLALAVRPRLLWVAAHYLELPSMLDDTWGCLLAAVEDMLQLAKLESDAHSRLLAMSATDGLLYKHMSLPQLQTVGFGVKPGAANKNFDAAAASALVELPEYRAQGLQVGVTVLQYMVWLVQGAVRRANSSGTAGPAEAVVAKRLLDITKGMVASDTAGVDIREWCRRMSRVLNSVLEGSASAEPQLANPFAAKGPGGPLFDLPQLMAVTTTTAAKQPGAHGDGARLPGGYNAAAGFQALGFGGGDSDSDDSDADVHAMLRRRRQGLPETKAGGKQGGKAGGAATAAEQLAAALAAARGSEGAEGEAAGGSAGGEGEEEDVDESAKEARRQEAAAEARRKEELAADSRKVGDPEVSGGAWGYPFGGPLAATLFISRRARRHRLLRWQLAAALSAASAAEAAETGEGAAGGGGRSDDTGPVLSASSGFRLDQRSFWRSLPGAVVWEELSGPSDPLELGGRYTVDSGGQVTVALRATNRWSSDLDDVEVQIRLLGPLRAERREASWALPRLMPSETATHYLRLMPIGYGKAEVLCRVLLPIPSAPRGEGVPPPLLHYAPLRISMARTLRPPTSPPRPEQFLHQWAGLPVRAEVSATCAWPGLDGLLRLLSALARQPLACAWQQPLPALCGVQAAYTACFASNPNDVLSFVIVGQLLPDSSAAAAAGAVDAAAGGGGGGVGLGPQRGVVQVLVRSSSHEGGLAVRHHAAEWLQDISQGTLLLGIMPPPARTSDKPLLHPGVARLDAAFRPAPLVAPPPPPVPPLVLPEPPEALRKLKPKKDEEDSDADDEEVPLTADEVGAQEAARAAHDEACRRARDKHSAARHERGRSLLRSAALAEWSRLAASAVA